MPQRMRRRRHRRRRRRGRRPAGPSCQSVWGRDKHTSWDKNLSFRHKESCAGAALFYLGEGTHRGQNQNKTKQNIDKTKTKQDKKTKNFAILN